MIVVDDRMLRSILMAEPEAPLRRLRRDHATATTSCWLYRLCQAVADPLMSGSLSGPVAALPQPRRLAIMKQLVRLPDDVALVSWRDIAWPMGELVQRHRLNLLALEAIAVARHLDATLVLGRAAASPLLLKAARIESVEVILA